MLCCIMKQLIGKLVVMQLHLANTPVVALPLCLGPAIVSRAQQHHSTLRCVVAQGSTYTVHNTRQAKAANKSQDCDLYAGSRCAEFHGR